MIQKMKKIIPSLLLVSFLSILMYNCTIDDATDEEGEIKGTGYLKNSDKALENVDEADFDEDIFNLPESFILDGPPIANQGETSQCVAFSGAYYILGMYNGLKGNSQNLNIAPSPEFAFAYFKKINNDSKCGDGCFLFSDPSENIIGMADILKNYGTCSWNQMPFVEQKTCAFTNSTQVEQAKVNKIDDYYVLSKNEFTNTDELKSWLYAGYPLWFAVDVDAGFADLKASAVWNKASGKNEGGHAMVIMGYDNKKNAFKIANSWGTEWADKGYGWVDYAYLTKLLKQDGNEIGILYPNEAQKPVFNKLSPASCGNANWGDLVVVNNLKQEIAIEMTGTNYENKDAENIDSEEEQFFAGMPKGTLKVKVFTANKATLIKEYNVNVTTCEQTELVVN
jgi:C1A family cysteine protease